MLSALSTHRFNYMTIIKDAFVEGRQTKVDWNDSQARQNQIKLDVFAQNVENFDGRAFRALIPMEQICPNTGEVLNVFPSRFAAAKWIVANVMKIKNDKNNTKAMSITGNMQMCEAMGYKSYGYYWKRVNKATVATKAVAAAKKLKGTAMYVLDARNQLVKDAVYASIREASRVTGVAESQIRRLMADGTPAYNGFVFRAYNAKAMKRTFATAKEASEFFGIAERHINNAVVKETAINNVLVSLKEEPKTVINVYSGRKIVAQYTNPNAAARDLGVSRHTVVARLKDGGRINNKRIVMGVAY